MLQDNSKYLPKQIPSMSHEESNDVAQPDPLLLEFLKQYPEPSVTAELIMKAEEKFKTPSTDISHLALRLGRFVKDLPRGVLNCPVYPFEEHSWYLRFRHGLFYLDEMEVTLPPASPVAYTPDKPYGHGGYNSSHTLIGYDVEYVTTEREVGTNEVKGVLTTGLKMVSHQIYFSFGLENICVILITDKRFTQKSFVRQFLGAAIPDSMVIYEQNN